MNVVTLKNYELHDAETGSHLQNFDFRLAQGEARTVFFEDADDRHLLARALATLASPVSGSYRFMDTVLDFKDYRNLLPYKKQIGYFGPDAALISNLTVRENLLLARAYFENRLDLDLGDNVKELCDTFHLTEKLDLRPTALSPLDIRMALLTREMTKSLKFLIMDSPEDLIGHPGFDRIVSEIKQGIASGIPLVLFCENDELNTRLANQAVRMT